MRHSKTGQVIIPCMQLTSLSSAGRGAANEMVKCKYLARHTEPLSFPEWNVAVGDNQANRCLHVRDWLPHLYCSLLLSHQFKVHAPGTSSSPSIAKTGTALMAGRTPMSQLQCGWALLAQRKGGRRGFRSLQRSRCSLRSVSLDAAGSMMLCLPSPGLAPKSSLSMAPYFCPGTSTSSSPLFPVLSWLLS